MIFEIYTQPKAVSKSETEWHWRLIKISNNAILATSSHGFENKSECEANIHLVMLTDYSTPVVEVNEKSRNVSFDKVLKKLEAKKGHRIV